MKIFLPTIAGPISSKLGTNHLWVMGILVYSNEVPCPFSRGDNDEIAKNTLMKFKKNLLQNHWANFNQTWHKASLGDGFEFVQMKGPTHEIAKIHWWNNKNFFSRKSSIQRISKLIAQSIHTWSVFKWSITARGDNNRIVLQ